MPIENFLGYIPDRNAVAAEISVLRRLGLRQQAQIKLVPYKIVRAIERTPNLLTNLGHDEVPYTSEINGSESSHSFPFPRPNEFYANPEFVELLKVPERERSKGVVIAVGSEQPLDLLVITEVNRVYAVDINPNTNLMTRGYVELGSRLHKILGRYPTTEEYLCMFENENISLALALLKTPSSGYSFSQREIEWLERRYNGLRIESYLRDKKEYFKEAGWIGNDQNLKTIIQAYEERRISICTGSISGDILPKITDEIKSRGEHVSLIYVSNAPVNNVATIKAFLATPTSTETKIIFSEFDRTLKRPSVHVPTGYRYAQEWRIYTFTLRDFDHWPNYLNPNEQEEYIDITNGYYLVRPKA